MIDSTARTAGQIAYDADLAATPTYADGGKRPAWQELWEVARWSWERNPTGRNGAERHGNGALRPHMPC